MTHFSLQTVEITEPAAQTGESLRGALTCAVENLSRTIRTFAYCKIPSKYSPVSGKTGVSFNLKIEGKYTVTVC